MTAGPRGAVRLSGQPRGASAPAGAAGGTGPVMAAAPRGPVRWSGKPRGASTTAATAEKIAPATRAKTNPRKLASQSTPPYMSRSRSSRASAAPTQPHGGGGGEAPPGRAGKATPGKARGPVHAAVHVAQPVLAVLGRLEVAPRVRRRVGRGVRLAGRSYDAGLLVPVALGGRLGGTLRGPLPRLPGLGLRVGRPAGRFPARSLLAGLPKRDPAGLLLVRVVPQPSRPAAPLPPAPCSLRPL